MATITNDEIGVKVDALAPEITKVWGKAIPAITTKITKSATERDDGGALAMLLLMDHDLKKFLYDIFLLIFALGYTVADLKSDGVTIDDLLGPDVKGSAAASV